MAFWQYPPLKRNPRTNLGYVDPHNEKIGGIGKLNGLIHDDCVAAKWSYGKADLLDLKIVFSDLIFIPVLFAIIMERLIKTT